MASEVKLTAMFEPVEGGWVQARIREIPEVITAGPTRAEAEDLLRDALLEYLATFSEPLDADRTSGDQQDLRLTVA